MWLLLLAAIKTAPGEGGAGHECKRKASANIYCCEVTVTHTAPAGQGGTELMKEIILLNEGDMPESNEIDMPLLEEVSVLPHGGEILPHGGEILPHGGEIWVSASLHDKIGSGASFVGELEISTHTPCTPSTPCTPWHGELDMDMPPLEAINPPLDGGGGIPLVEDIDINMQRTSTPTEKPEDLMNPTASYKYEGSELKIKYFEDIPSGISCKKRKPINRTDTGVNGTGTGVNFNFIRPVVGSAIKACRSYFDTIYLISLGLPRIISKFRIRGTPKAMKMRLEWTEYTAQRMWEHLLTFQIEMLKEQNKMSGQEYTSWVAREMLILLNSIEEITRDLRELKTFYIEAKEKSKEKSKDKTDKTKETSKETSKDMTESVNPFIYVYPGQREVLIDTIKELDMKILGLRFGLVQMLTEILRHHKLDINALNRMFEVPGDVEIEISTFLLTLLEISGLSETFEDLVKQEAVVETFILSLREKIGAVFQCKLNGRETFMEDITRFIFPYLLIDPIRLKYHLQEIAYLFGTPEQIQQCKEASAIFLSKFARKVLNTKQGKEFDKLGINLRRNIRTVLNASKKDATEDSLKLHLKMISGARLLRLGCYDLLINLYNVMGDTQDRKLREKLMRSLSEWAARAKVLPIIVQSIIGFEITLTEGLSGTDF